MPIIAYRKGIIFLHIQANEHQCIVEVMHNSFLWHSTLACDFLTPPPPSPYFCLTIASLWKNDACFASYQWRQSMHIFYCFASYQWRQSMHIFYCFARYQWRQFMHIFYCFASYQWRQFMHIFYCFASYQWKQLMHIFYCFASYQWRQSMHIF